MKLHFYGTGASEGVPAAFCECKYCRNIRKIGGKNLRMRTCAQLDDRLLVDFSMDIYAQTLFRNLDLSLISYVLITHSHEDHFSPHTLTTIMPPWAFYERERLLEVYGNETVIHKVMAAIEQLGEVHGEMEQYLNLCQLEYFQAKVIGKYRVMPLPANHDQREKCMVFIIQDKEKTLLYGHDSGRFDEMTWEVFGDYKFDCVVLDCTMVDETGVYGGHMGLPDNIAVRERMMREGRATDNTKFVLTHFVHRFNPLHERITPLFADKGFIAAYDGMDIVF